MHRTILVSAPEGPALDDALSLAVGLARPRGAQVIVLARAGVPEGVADHAPADVPVTVAPDPVAADAEALHAAVARHGAEVLVVDPVTAGQVTHEAPCAIAVAPAGSAEGAPGEPRQIVVAWDHSPEADEALEWAVQLGERTAGAIRIVHVFEHAGVGRIAGPDVRARLEEVRTAASARVSATAELRTGHAAAELLDALQGADLLVMGSRAHGSVLQVMLGSVSTAVLRDASCPTVILPRGVHAPVETTV